MGLKLIGIHGKAGSGKDTLGNYLVEDHNFHRMAFADPVKAAVAIIFDWPLEKLHDPEFKKTFSDYWGISVRQATQKTGTEAVRGTFGNDHWVKRWLLDYVKIEKKRSVVVTDVREEAEADCIRAMGGVIVHLYRDEAGLSGTEATHSSEKGITFRSTHDIEINNNGTLVDLWRASGALIQFIETITAENEKCPIKNLVLQD